MWHRELLVESCEVLRGRSKHGAADCPSFPLLSVRQYRYTGLALVEDLDSMNRRAGRFERITIISLSRASISHSDISIGLSSASGLMHKPTAQVVQALAPLALAPVPLLSAPFLIVLERSDLIVVVLIHHQDPTRQGLSSTLLGPPYTSPPFSMSYTKPDHIGRATTILTHRACNISAPHGIIRRMPSNHVAKIGSR